MSDLDRFLLLCDLLPEASANGTAWRRAVQSVARILVDHQYPPPWRVAEALARIPVQRSLGSDRFSTSAAAGVSRAFANSLVSNALLASVCVMTATLRVLQSSQLSAPRKLKRRDSIALALWSALSFQKPLPGQRLEDVRAEMLDSARRTALDLARRGRTRRPIRDGASLDAQNSSFRWNAVLDREEIEVLRWTLADESTLLERPYSEVRSDETVAVARGLELGLLLTKLPIYRHYELASRDAASGHEINLGGLLEALGEDRHALVSPFEGKSDIAACPTVFPLLTALEQGVIAQADAAVARSLPDWCGRALLESAIFKHMQANGRRS